MPWYAGSDTAGVLTLNGASGAVTLAVVGGSIATAGSTITITITPGVTSWADLSGKPSTFPPSTHGHIVADVTGLQAALDGKQAAGSYVLATDSRLSDSREWSAATVTQAQAEAGIDTGRLAFTVVRVWQAIAAWWAASSAKTKLDGIAAGATANSSDATLLARASHTGTQAAATISDFSAAAALAVTWTTITGKPATFAPSAHTHAIADTTGLQTALDGKSPIASPAFTGTVSGITKSMVGLSAVDNVADASKPVSALQAAANAAVQAYAIQRANHTGTQAASTVSVAGGYGAFTPFPMTVEGALSSVSGALDNKADSSPATTTNLGPIIVGTGLGVTSGTVSVSYGTSSSTACVGNDARLSNARTPTAHNHDGADITTGTLVDARLSDRTNVASTLYLWSSFR